jgi:ABC-2 type transport system permease protein
VPLYGRYVDASLYAQMQYPWSFLMVAAGQFVATLRFSECRRCSIASAIEEWRLGEVALFYGTVSVSFAIADAISRGFDVFGAGAYSKSSPDILMMEPARIGLAAT